MEKEAKFELVEALGNKFKEYNSFYVTDISGLTVNETTSLRRLCEERGVELRVVKNTLIKKALERVDVTDDSLYGQLKGSSSLMFHETANVPAKLIKDFREELPKPVLKVAYIDTAIYIGDDQVDTLTKIKSREELVGEVVGLLQSPAKNVVSALKSAGGKILGLLETMSNKED